MGKILLPTIACFSAGMFLFGCVGQGSYQKKVDEASGLSREATQMRQRNLEISRENDELKMEVAGLGRKVDELELSRKKLEDMLSAKPDQSSQRLIELERENDRLKGEVDRVLRGREGDVRGVSRIYENLIERIKDEIARGQIKISEFRGRVTMTVSGSELFYDGKSLLKPSGAVVLGKLAGILKDLGGKDVQIGSTFNMTKSETISGADNGRHWQLHAERVIAVEGILEAQGIAPLDLNATACGRIELLEAGSKGIDSAITEPIVIVVTVKE